MKAKNIVLVAVIGLLVLTLCYNRSDANAAADNSSDSKIGVLSVRYVFENSKKNDTYRQNAVAEQDKLIAELEMLSKEIDAAQAGLKTLKPDSSDFMDQSQELMQKQAMLEAKREFYKRKMETKDQRWTEELYKAVLEATAEVAAKKGLDVVLERDEPEMPTTSPNELMLLVRTHKVLYAGGAVDISNDVLAVVDGK